MTELLERSARHIDEGVYEGTGTNPADASFPEVPGV